MPRRYLILSLCLAIGVAVSACSSSAASSNASSGRGGGSRGGRGRGGDSGAAPVVTARVTEKDVPVDIAAIGNIEAYATISIRSQVTGQLTDIGFREGDFVKQGQQLFTLDRRPFEAALTQAEANLTRDKALLAQAEAQLSRDAANAEYQQLTAERQAQLNSRGIIARDQADQARAQADATAAVVKADRAAVDSAKAQLAAQDAAVVSARVSLGYTMIRSPVEGRTSSVSVKAGGLVTANQTELTTIARVQPVFVTFSVPAVHLPTIKKHSGDGQLTVIAVPQDADAQPASGTLTFVDNAVDVTTDTIKLKATLPNPDRRLWPGQFARVTLRLTTLPHALVVPSQAVQTGQDGQYVFVVKDDSTVEQRPIASTQHVNDDAVIDKGLSAGETVVTEGQLRLEPGARVTTDLNAPTAGRGRGGRGRGR